MRHIDGHIHTQYIPDSQLQKLAMMGMEASVNPTLQQMLDPVPSYDAVMIQWELNLELEVTKARSLGFEAFAGLAVPFVGMKPRDAEKCLSELPDYLKHERVVAIGEIGMDYLAQDTITQWEIDLFREQLRLAKAHSLPVIAHTPTPPSPQGPAVVPKMLEIIKEEDYPLTRCVLDHAGMSTLDLRFKSEAMVGLSVCWDKMPPEQAAQVIIDNPDKLDRLMVNCELGGTRLGGDVNDYHMVPRVILALRMKGLDKQAMEKVFWQNPKDFFKLPVS